MALFDTKWDVSFVMANPPIGHSWMCKVNFREEEAVQIWLECRKLKKNRPLTLQDNGYHLPLGENQTVKEFLLANPPDSGSEDEMPPPYLQKQMQSGSKRRVPDCRSHGAASYPKQDLEAKSKSKSWETVSNCSGFSTCTGNSVSASSSDVAADETDNNTAMDMEVDSPGSSLASSSKRRKRQRTSSSR